MSMQTIQAGQAGGGPPVFLALPSLAESYHPGVQQDIIATSLKTIEDFIRYPHRFVIPPNSDILEEAIKVAIAARGRFKEISADNQDKIWRLTGVLARNAADIIEPLTCEKYFMVFDIFCNPDKVLKAVEPSAALTRAAQEQIQVIAKFWKDLVTHYLLAMHEDSPCQVLKDEILAELNETLPGIVAELFFQTPRNVNSLEKRFILCLLREFENFFCHYIQTIKPRALDITDDGELQLIEKLSKKNKYKIIDGTYEEKVKDLRKQMYKHLLAQMQRLIPFLFNKCSRSITVGERVSSLIISMGLLEIFNRAFTPASFSLVVGRFMTDMFSFETHHQLPSQTRDCSDKQFSDTAGGILTGMGRSIVAMGEPEGLLMTPMTSLLNVVMSCAKRQIGDFFQMKLNEATHDESPYKPFRFLHHIFFRNDNGKIVPTLFEQFPTSQQEMRDLQQRVSESLSNNLHPMLVGIVQEKSSLGGKLISSDSVRNYCNRLTQRLYNLSQRELVLKVFLARLLEEIADELERR